MAVRPGFLYKNQRAGRFPPDIKLFRFLEDQDICPVFWLNKWRSLDDQSQLLFYNSRTGRPLSAGSISSILCSLIEEADPGRFPQGHDLRRYSTSLAWVRGTSPEQIARAVFWQSSTAFVQRYLLARLEDVPCSVVAGRPAV